MLEYCFTVDNRTPQTSLPITYLHKWSFFYFVFLEWKMDFFLHNVIIVGSADAWYQPAKV